MFSYSTGQLSTKMHKQKEVTFETFFVDFKITMSKSNFLKMLRKKLELPKAINRSFVKSKTNFKIFYLRHFQFAKIS